MFVLSSVAKLKSSLLYVQYSISNSHYCIKKKYENIVYIVYIFFKNIVYIVYFKRYKIKSAIFYVFILIVL